jgi:hypothetical protein
MNTLFRNKLASGEQCANEQQRLLNAIWCDDPNTLAQSGFDIRGINIYQRNLLANAQRALSISFPTIFKLLDSDVSEQITLQFLKASPPVQGDWAQWGGAFSSFIETTDIGDEYSYLSDCAALDWHVHGAQHGIDQTFELSSLQKLSDFEPEHIFIKFNQNVKLMKTVYPITDIFYAHHGDDEQQRKANMNNAQQALASTLEEQTVMIYRPEFQPKVTTLMAGENIFMHSLMSGLSLAESLSNANGNSHFSFEQWLVKAIERNLIYYFKEN